MKLKEAIFKMILGDKWKTLKQGKTLEKIGEYEFRWESGSALSMLEFLQYSDQEGEIIPAEPKVLTADEYENETFAPEENQSDLSKAQREMCRRDFNAGHENGRLERDIELRPVIDYCTSQANQNYHAYWHRLLGLLRSIPPLKR